MNHQPPKELRMDPLAYTASLKELRITHAADLAAVEREANEIGGELTVVEIIALLIRRGWQPPVST